MKTLQVLVLTMLLTTAVFAVKVGDLEVLKPSNLKVDGNELYVVEGVEVKVFSLKDLKLLKTFGKKGEGPGEFKLRPYFHNSVQVTPNDVMALGITKLIRFSKDGKLLKELKTPRQSVKILPLGKNYVIKRIKYSDDKTMYNAICLHDPEMKEIKEIYRQKHVSQGQPPHTKAKLDMVMDLLYFEVYKDKLYIEESTGGFVIGVYDIDGNKQKQIKFDFEPRKVTAQDEERLLNQLKEDPIMKMVMQQVGSWTEFQKMYEFKYAETYPAIQYFTISDGKIYVQTFKEKGDKTEYVIMDVNGKNKKTVYMPTFENRPVMAKVFDSKLHTIDGGKMYYLLENDAEDWELHVEKIK